MVETLYTSTSYLDQQYDEPYYYDNTEENEQIYDDMDTDTYMKYVKQLMEEQGYDYEQWLKEIIEQNPEYMIYLERVKNFNF
jgi:hypothetical protein